MSDFQSQDPNAAPPAPPAPAAPAAPAGQYAGQYGGGYAPAQPRYNTLAIVGFILAFVVNIAGLVVSIIARNQIKKTGERGSGLALAGIIISIVSLVFAIIYIIFIVAVVGAAVQQGNITY